MIATVGLVVGAGPVWAAAGVKEPVAVGGLISVTDYGSDGKEMGVRESRFFASDIKDGFQISREVARDTFAAPPGASPVTNELEVFTEKECYLLMRTGTGVVSTVREAGGLPEDSEGQMIWLGFFAEGFFGGKGAARTAPMWLAIDPPAAECVQRFEFFPGGSRQIKELRILSPGYYYLWQPTTDPYRTRSVKTNYASPFNRGFLAAEFRVTAFTNLGSRIIPLACEYRTFYPLANGTSTNDVRVILVTSVSVTNVEAGFGAELRPPISATEPVQVSDLRFVKQHGLPLHYTLTNGIFLQKDDPRLANILAAQTTAEMRWYRLMGFVVLPICLLMAVAFIIHRNRSQFSANP